MTQFALTSDPPFPAHETPDPTDVRSTVIQTLEADPIFRGRLALGAIQIDAEGGKVVLRGRLPSFYLKQRLQELALHVSGVHGVENLIEVTNW